MYKIECGICNNNNKITSVSYNDCITEFLEKIKLHFLDSKSKLHEKDKTIANLTATNKELTEVVSKLKDELEKRSPNNYKRRKTSSIGESPPLSGKSSIDSLNEGIKLDPNWEESFFVASQRTSKPSDVDNILKPLNKSEKKLSKASSDDSIIPRRLKLSARKGTTNESQTTPKWKSKENIKLDASKLEIRDWNLSFLQPSKNKENVCEESPNKKAKSRLSLRSENKLRQTRLKFGAKQDDTILPDSDETFCDDLVTPSPTSIGVPGDESSKQKLRTIRKLGKVKKLSPEKIHNTVDPINPKKVENIKEEKSLHSMARRPLGASVFQLENKEASEMNTNSSSVFILPSQPDDIILIEETNQPETDNINSENLLKEMLIKSDETSDFFKNIEQQCISKLRNNQDKKVESSVIKKPEEDDDSLRTRLKSDCAECQAYFNIVGKNLSDEEIRRRILECTKHKKIIHDDTPSGFWNPEFPSTQEDDIRHKTLVDTRFIKEKL